LPSAARAASIKFVAFVAVLQNIRSCQLIELAGSPSRQASERIEKTIERDGALRIDQEIEIVADADA
jgi:hypothetical protein